MITFVRLWSLFAALVTAAVTLTACAGSSGSPVPPAPGQIAPAGFFDAGAQLHVVTPEGVPVPAACPKQFALGCATVSVSKGLALYWCDGPSSKSPCTTTKNYTWSGDVCLAKATKCGKIEQMTAKWTGPFPCSKKPKRCYDDVKKGDYEVDTISIGNTPPKQSKQYLYKQAIALDGKVQGYVGLAVGP